MEDSANAGKLIESLIEAESCAGMVLQHLDDLRTWILGSPIPGDLTYVEPPQEPHPPIRQPPEAPHAAWRRRFDSYHELLRDLRQAIDSARQAATDASGELDAGESRPLQTPSFQVRRALQDLGGSFPYPRSYGPYPPINDESVMLAARETLAKISWWVDELRVLVQRPTQSDEEVVTRRIPNEARKTRVLKVLNTIRADHREFIPRIDLKKLGISDTTVKKHWERTRDQNPGGKKEIDGRVHYSRMFLIQYVRDSWNPADRHRGVGG